ncbi:hypothetical protein CMS2917 [Clavibacter sepedonicus]|uniref:Uncharacterized protein n=1 Tax=Clavibacter sepedonicus TaxID=31964 RepID=B0RCA0_CLASE|nr:hypothetical protein CMS2917 [Clavibacter sepedonicus]
MRRDRGDGAGVGVSDAFPQISSPAASLSEPLPPAPLPPHLLVEPHRDEDVDDRAEVALLQERLHRIAVVGGGCVDHILQLGGARRRATGTSLRARRRRRILVVPATP